jgi:enoyl-CoA hydratase/carnithine racemase
MSSETFLVERRDDGVAVVTINRPDRMNAMNKTFFYELSAVFDDLDGDDDVGAAVLTGAGRAFSAGGDIEMFESLTDTQAYRRQVKLVLKAFNDVEMADVPVIGAINGIAFGGGTELTLACDLAIASERARFAFKEVTVGLMPSYGVLRGPDVIGLRATRYLALTGRDIDAHRAREIGLVDEVVAHDDLLDEAIALAAEIASNARFGVRYGKTVINRNQGYPGFGESVDATALLFGTDDHKDAVAAFLESRGKR